MDSSAELKLHKKVIMEIESGSKLLKNAQEIKNKLLEMFILGDNR